MLIFLKQLYGLRFQPIVVVDYTRSDEQYTTDEILKLVSKSISNIDKIPDFSSMEIYSLNYRVVYKHSGINPADSLKVSCTIEIDNAPNDLANLINIKQFTKQQSALSLQSVVNNIIDPQVIFPYCSIILKNDPSFFTDSALYNTSPIVRNVIVYNTSQAMDGKRINNTLVLSCGSFSSLVIGLNTAVEITKDLPLIAQLQSSLASSGYLFKASPDIIGTLPKIEKYYQPGTLNNILSEIATDFGLFIDINDTEKTVYIKSLNPDSLPPTLDYKKFCFRGKIPDAKIISNFSVQDYSRGYFETEFEDIRIFDSILVFDDSDSIEYFENFIEFPLSVKGIKAYKFYVQEYTILEDRQQTKLKIIASNNWVVSNFKLNYFLENAIYKGAF